MKKLFCAMVLSVGMLSALAETRVWTGASGNWSDAANWQNGAVPAAGDTVYVSNTVGGVTINFDAAVTVASIRFEGASPVELTGEPLTLTGGWSFKANQTAGNNKMNYHTSTFPFFSWSSAVNCRVPIVLMPSASTCGICTTTNELHFYEAVTVGKEATCYIHNGFNPNEDEVAAGMPNTTYLTSVYFHEDVLAENAIWRSTQYPCGATYCYKRLVVKDLRYQGWTSAKLYLYSNENSWQSVEADYGNSYMAMCEGAFPSSSVFALNTTMPSDGTTYNLGNFDMVIDRLDGTEAGIAAYAAQVKNGYIRSSSSIDGGGTASPVTLTLKGTADGTTPLRVLDKISLVWDPVGDYTQTFTNRESTTTGSLTVKRGTLRICGGATFAKASGVTIAADATFALDTTAAHALAGVQTLDLGANARFRMGAAASDPFTAETVIAQLASGAKIVVPAGATVSLKALSYDGAFLENGTYAASGANAVPWIEGEGSVVIAANGVSVWKQPANGDWEDADNWVGSVPDGTQKAVYVINASDSGFTVRVNSVLAAFPTNFFLCNAGEGVTTLAVAADVTATRANMTIGHGGLLRVDEGATFLHTTTTPEAYSQLAWSNRDKVSSVISITDGGEWLTAGGTTVITNFVGTFSVEGSSSSESRLSLRGGLFRFEDLGSAWPLQVLAGGRIDMRDGNLHLPHHGYNHDTDLKLAGGTLYLSNTTFKTDGKFPTSNGGSIYFGTGETILDSGASFLLAGGNQFLRPNAAGETATIRMKGTGGFANNYPTLRMGGMPGGLSVLDCSSTPASDSCYIPYIVGADSGEAKLFVREGAYLIAHEWGFCVGMGGEATATSPGVEGWVDVAGRLYVRGSFHPGWGASHKPSGIAIGYGGYTAVREGRPYVGHMRVSGVCEQNSGHAIIGAGYGAGDFTQDGGTTTFFTSGDCKTYNSVLAIGFAGGLGTFAVSNGAVCVKNGDTHVGGCYTNGIFMSRAGDVYYEAARSTWAANGCPVERQDGEGTLRIVGGAFTNANLLAVGSWGRGTLEMVGSAGALVTKNLILSNATASVARFVADAQGFSPITVTDTLTVTDGTRFEVDLAAYTGKPRSMTLAAFNAFAGDFDDVEVAFTDGTNKPGPFKIWKTDSAILFARSSGTVVIFR